MFAYAAQLPLLLLLCFFVDSSLHLCICNVCSLHQVSHGWGFNGMEGNERVASISGANDILFHISLVCWRSHWISFISHLHQSGMFLLLCKHGPLDGFLCKIMYSHVFCFKLWFSKGTPQMCNFS